MYVCMWTNVLMHIYIYIFNSIQHLTGPLLVSVTQCPIGKNRMDNKEQDQGNIV